MFHNLFNTDNRNYSCGINSQESLKHSDNCFADNSSQTNSSPHIALDTPLHPDVNIENVAMETSLGKAGPRACFHLAMKNIAPDHLVMLG